MKHACLIAVLLSGLPFAAAGENTGSTEGVYAPVIVGTPPSDAFIGLSLMADGEVRHYNYGSHPEPEHPVYLSSRDGGRTWKSVALPYELPYADIQSPVSGEFVRLFCTGSGVYALRTEGGLEGGRSIVKIDDTLGIMNKPPLFIRGGKRVISGAHRTDRSGAFVYYSDDDGRTWKVSSKVNAPLHEKGGFHEGEPSPFYGTITMPTLFRMGDGRLLFFWCNTTPLPELPTATGVWDDVFTNRDAVHVAISEDDGKTWFGFRELLLNTERNSANFGDTRPGQDKSVHQVQAVEVAPGKILVSVGQHPLCRKLVLFDAAWLYEPRRSCDFDEGLDNWSAFRYYKGITGHCCYNRQEMPLLAAHPDREGAKVLHIGYTPNDSLVQDNDGAVWNFPAAPDGSVNVSLKIPEGSKGAQLILNDRWFNPTDTVARYECMYRLDLNRETLRIRDDKWHTVTVEWEKNAPATLLVDGRRRGKLPVVAETEHGVSYLHFLGGREPDTKGVFIEHVDGGKR